MCFYVFRMCACFHVCDYKCFYPACFYPHLNDDEAVIVSHFCGWLLIHYYYYYYLVTPSEAAK